MNSQERMKEYWYHLNESNKGRRSSMKLKGK